MLRGVDPIFVALFPLAGKAAGFPGAVVSTQLAMPRSLSRKDPPQHTFELPPQRSSGCQHTSRPADGLACRCQG
jgi:hypothetical protein